MKVLFVHARYKLKGGEDSVVANEIALLRSNGITVELLSFENSSNTLLKLLQLPFNYSAYYKTRAIIRSFRPDVVHIHNLHFSGTAAVLYAIKKYDLPIVKTLHNYRMLCPSGSLYHHNKLFTKSICQNFPWDAVKKGVYRNSVFLTFWIALSTYIHERLKTWDAVDRWIVLGKHSMDIFSKSRLHKYAGRMVIKPNFCDWPDGADPLQITAPFHYLYIGRLTAEKGVNVMLEAFAKNHLPVKIVGAGPLQDLVKAYDKQYTNISYLGTQHKTTINTLLDHSHALIFPSLWYETFGMVIIEAFAKKVPVIISDLGNMKNMVTHGINGLTFAPGSAESLNNAIAHYQSLNHQEKEKYRQNAYTTYVDQYSPGKNLDQLLAIYQSAINRHSYHP